jgi:hypothetical protein
VQCEHYSVRRIVVIGFDVSGPDNAHGAFKGVSVDRSLAVVWALQSAYPHAADVSILANSDFMLAAFNRDFVDLITAACADVKVRAARFSPDTSTAALATTASDGGSSDDGSGSGSVTPNDLLLVDGAVRLRRDGGVEYVVSVMEVIRANASKCRRYILVSSTQTALTLADDATEEHYEFDADTPPRTQRFEAAKALIAALRGFCADSRGEWTLMEHTEFGGGLTVLARSKN